MEHEFRRWLTRSRARFAPLMEWLRTVSAVPGINETVSVRMCPSCGRITAKHKKLCLECGEPLKTPS